MDIISPMPTGKGHTKFIVVVVDYFTKWVEIEPSEKTENDRACMRVHHMQIWNLLSYYYEQ